MTSKDDGRRNDVSSDDSMRQKCKPQSTCTSQTCVEIKVQLVLQFGVSRGLREVLLAPVGRVYLSEIVSKLEPKTWPRCRNNSQSLVDFHTVPDPAKNARAEE